MRYRFADCTFDTDRRQLRRAGELLALRPKVFELLFYLLAQRERAVSKQELFEKLWPRRVVSDTTLNSCIKELRLAVGDSGDAQRLIQTVHGFGYRFVARVESGAAPLPAEATDAVAEAPGEVPMARSSIDAGEHKQVTMLACTIAGAEELAARLGAEAMDALMRDFMAASARVITAHRGTVGDWSADGFTAIFGAPLAIEDHARAAIRAALLLRDTARRGIGGVPLSLRQGLHAGSMVVGPLAGDAGRYFAPVAVTALHVQRIVREAPEDGIVATAAVMDLAAGEVDATPIRAESGENRHRIDRLIADHAGVPGRNQGPLTSFIGREQELALLSERMRRLDAGRGQVVSIVGEAGAGKSRLLQEFALHAGGLGIPPLEVQCLPYFSSTPYFPVSQLVRKWIAAPPDADAATTGAAVATALRTCGIDELDAAPLLLELLGHRPPDELLEALGPEARRARTFGYLTRLFTRRSPQYPLIVAIEDVHWIDATSVAWLAQFVTAIAGVPMLLVVTCRPGHPAAWATHSHVTQLALPPLSDAQSARLVQAAPRGTPIAAETARKIVARAGGNPFFLEQLTWAAENLESGTGLQDVPMTVHAVLAERIDQLAPGEKYLLQLAAVMGLEFGADLLGRVSQFDDGSRETCLAALQGRELIEQTPAGAAAGYRFRHALTHDVAYQSLLASTRRQLHARVAAELERRSSSVEPELLAHHYSAAGLEERAWPCWKRAGERALARSANKEAVAHFRRALESCGRVAETTGLQRERLDLLLAIGPPMMATSGFAAAEVASAYEQALALCRSCGSDREAFAAHWGMWLHHMHRADIDAARHYARRVLELAQRIGSSTYSLQAHHGCWTTELLHGDLKAAQHHAQRGLALYDRSQHHTECHLYGGHDASICARGTVALTCWWLGFPETALAEARRGVEQARTLTHPYSGVLASNDIMFLRQLRGEPRELEDQARAAIEVCSGLQTANYLALAHIMHGWARAMQGDTGPGLAELRAGLDSCRALGIRRNGGYFFTLLAECLARADAPEEALAATDTALTQIVETGEIRWLPDARRLRGTILAGPGSSDPGSAEHEFRLALEAARAQGALGLELRAATGLARLWRSAGRVREASELVQPVYAAFTEGFELPDLRDAASLLN